MRDGPDMARLAALIGDPARAAMLAALLDRQALTAGELAREAGLGKSAASAHLAKLTQGGLLAVEKQGRHRYHRLAGEEIAELLERMMSAAERGLGRRTRPGPRDPDLRASRVCYDHLAGARAVRLYDALIRRGHLLETPADDGVRLALSAEGERFAQAFGVDLEALRARRRPLLRPCLDWSERRRHLAGSLGAAFLDAMLARGWARRRRDSRALDWSPAGGRAFDKAFPGA